MTMPNLIGRSVRRVFLHNGVHLGSPPNAKVEKVLFCKAADLAIPPGKIAAESMTVTPAGVLMTFSEAKNYDKLVPFANIYEAELMPEVQVLSRPLKAEPKK